MEAEENTPRAAPPLAQLLVRDPDPALRAVSDTAVWALAGGRFVVPDRADLAAQALRSYNRLRPAGTGRTRAALAVLLRTPARRVLADRVLLPSADPPSLLDHLATVLGEPRLVFAGTDAGGTGWRTPVLQLFTSDGAPRGYAKIGWDPVTTAMIDDRGGRARPRRRCGVAIGARSAPRLARHVSRPDRAGHRTDACCHPPAPPRRDARGPRAASRSRRSTDRGGSSRRRRSSRFCDRGRRHGAQAHRASTRLQRCVAVSEITAADAEIAFGSWHGDWVEWNLGIAGDVIVAWDWAYCAADVPFGFDVLQFFHLRHRNLRGRAPSVALRARGHRRHAVPARSSGLDADQVARRHHAAPARGGAAQCAGRPAAGGALANRPMKTTTSRTTPGPPTADGADGPRPLRRRVAAP